MLSENYHSTSENGQIYSRISDGKPRGIITVCVGVTFVAILLLILLLIAVVSLLALRYGSSRIKRDGGDAVPLAPTPLTSVSVSKSIMGRVESFGLKHELGRIHKVYEIFSFSCRKYSSPAS